MAYLLNHIFMFFNCCLIFMLVWILIWFLIYSGYVCRNINLEICIISFTARCWEVYRHRKTLPLPQVAFWSRQRQWQKVLFIVFWAPIYSSESTLFIVLSLVIHAGMSHTGPISLPNSHNTFFVCVSTNSLLNVQFQWKCGRFCFSLPSSTCVAIVKSCAILIVQPFNVIISLFVCLSISATCLVLMLT